MATQRDGSSSEAERLHSVRRALAVLEALVARPEGASPKELSLALGLHLSTCYRMLNTLVAAGYATHSPDGLFRLGSRVAYLNFGYLAALRPPPEALPFVHALQIATAETAMLQQLEGDIVVATFGVAGSHPDAVTVGYVGMAAPAHAIAAGRVLLAGLPACQIESYLTRHATGPEARFPLTNPDALRAELERIRTVGYAVDHGDGNYDVCCIAAPLVDATGAVEAAIAAVGPCARFRQEEPALVAAVLAVSRAIGALQAASPALETDASRRPTIEDRIAEISAAMSRVS